MVFTQTKFFDMLRVGGIQILESNMPGIFFCIPVETRGLCRRLPNGTTQQHREYHPQELGRQRESSTKVKSSTPTMQPGLELLEII